MMKIQIMQTIGFLGPAFFLTQLKHIDSPAMAVLCMACSQGTDAFSQSGLYSNHQDIAPRYSVSVNYYSQVLTNLCSSQKQMDLTRPCCWCGQGVLLGLSNTAGVLAGVLGTAATGHILQHGQDSLNTS